MKTNALISVSIVFCLLIVIPTKTSATEVMDGEYDLKGAYNITGSYIADSNGAVISGNTSVWYSYELASFIVTNYENNSQYAISLGELYVFGILMLNNYIGCFMDSGDMESTIMVYDLSTGDFASITPSHFYSLMFSMAYPNSTLGTSILYGNIDMFGTNLDLYYYSTETTETYSVTQTKIPATYWIESNNWALSWNGEYVGCGIQNDTQSRVWFGNTVTGEEFTILSSNDEYVYSVISITNDNIAMLYDNYNETIMFWDLDTNQTVYDSYYYPLVFGGLYPNGMVGDLFWYLGYNDTNYYTVVVNASTGSEIILDAGFISGTYPGIPAMYLLSNGTYELILTQYGGGEGVRSIDTEPNVPGDEYYGGAYLYFFEPIPQNGTNESSVSDITEIITALLPVLLSILVVLIVLRFFMGILIGKRKKE
jgi:hypothetical protein